jgi:hypothetical protein
MQNIEHPSALESFAGLLTALDSIRLFDSFSVRHFLE